MIPRARSAAAPPASCRRRTPWARQGSPWSAAAPLGSPPGTGPCVQVFASGVILGTASLAYPDLDGSGGLGTNDISLWLGDFALGEPIGRSDFDGDGRLDASDLSLWLGIWGAAHSTQSATSYCP